MGSHEAKAAPGHHHTTWRHHGTAWSVDAKILGGELTCFHEIRFTSTDSSQHAAFGEGALRYAITTRHVMPDMIDKEHHVNTDLVGGIDGPNGPYDGGEALWKARMAKNFPNKKTT